MNKCEFTRRQLCQRYRLQHKRIEVSAFSSFWSKTVGRLTLVENPKLNPNKHYTWFSSHNHCVCSLYLLRQENNKTLVNYANENM